MKGVTEALFALTAPDASGGSAAEGKPGNRSVGRVEDIDRLAYPVRWGRVNFVHPDFGFVNRWSQFDYQRQHVFVRTRRKSPKPARPTRPGRSLNRKLRVSRTVVLESSACPHCRSREVVGLPNRKRVRRAFDLVITPGAIRRKVLE